ncbi:hypothetical protein [Rhodospira trueperi]|uniref:Uncharacterized protein n=1 Tax=Rhodospira trueperi TaxID=69960 RepID=A0A1G7E499_9PROT|nr:hypothetical protein [Rhodospira trueperi]SDE58554.1 hypothetical protein SAMN05421720_108168 [Rhodospira trueperi]
MLKTATVAFAAALFASSAAMACSGWKSAENPRPITTAQVDGSTLSPAPWTTGESRN